MLLPRQEPRLVPSIISERRRKAKGSGARMRVRRVPRPSSVKPVERIYYRELIRMIAALKQTINELIVPNIAKFVREFEQSRPKLDSLHTDDFDEEFEAALQSARLQFFRNYTDEEMQSIADRVASRVNNFNEKNFKDAFKSVLGVDVMSFEPWLQNEIKAFTKANVSLIKSIPNQMFDRIEQQVIRGVTAGKLTKDIERDIREAYGVTERRAALIARDQVNKFNGNLNEQRQKSVGISKYIWRTSMDERVRVEHAEREGDSFSWDNPPEDGHPGEPINCRCYAEPIFDENDEE